MSRACGSFPGLLWVVAGLALAAAVFLFGSRADAQNTESPRADSGQAAIASGEQVIKVQAPSVVVDVIVTDKKGRPVRGLTAADFAVYENNRLQKIVTFVPPITPAGAVREPAALSASDVGTVREPDLPPAAPPKPGEREARDLASVHFITLVLDFGDLQPAHIKHACDAASRYLQKDVAPDDFIAIYGIDQSLHLALAFTKDKQQALVALDHLSGRTTGGRLTTQARLETEQEIQDLNQEIYGLQASSGLGVGATATAPGNGPGGGGTGQGAQAAEVQMQKIELATLMKFLWSQSALQARAVLVALRALAQAYQSLPGRKNVVVFSEGFLHSPEVEPEMQAVIDAANRANVAFYVIDAGGLVAEYYDASNASPPDTTGMRESFRMSNWSDYDRISTGLSKFDWAAHMAGTDSRHEDLGRVAVATGGLMMKNQNDLLTGLESVDRDLREFYTLVYQPSDVSYDGSFRPIKVEALAPGLHVRYRQGYWAIQAGEEMMMTPAAAQLVAALANGSLRPAFAPAVNAAALFALDGKLVAPVRVSLPARMVTLERAGDHYRGGVTLVLLARDASGRPVSVYQRFLTLDLTHKQWEEFRKKNLDISARLSLPELKPLTVEGILQLPSGTVAVGHCEVVPSAKTPAPATSSVAGPAPNLDTGPALTSLLLSNSIVPAQGAGDPGDPLRGENFQIDLPVAARFAPSDKLTLYYGILLGDATGLGRRLLASYTIKSVAGVGAPQPADELTIRPTQNRLLVLKQFDLNRFAPGKYTMQVTVADALTHSSASTSAGFSVE
ncbi:MAG: VWA domain-containing protein [Terriglobia bacterium]